MTPLIPSRYGEIDFHIPGLLHATQHVAHVGRLHDADALRLAKRRSERIGHDGTNCRIAGRAAEVRDQQTFVFLQCAGCQQRAEGANSERAQHHVPGDQRDE